jgi:hypothetical protein
MTPYTYGVATFLLSGLTSDVEISNVVAAYGTAPEGTPAGELATVPEPATALLFAGCLLGLAMVRKRRKG